MRFIFIKIWKKPTEDFVLIWGKKNHIACSTRAAHFLLHLKIKDCSASARQFNSTDRLKRFACFICLVK
ncbi:hypothetical protein LWI28_003911 [Acer negundo]|uniref:Uncharacterized protein n=1 Tax=Acer negundo TaxID=4023 RepID=A0AAD5P2L8_ACENE|nr:hypothetical protein LWI28_003911 [Acer negundo]